MAVSYGIPTSPLFERDTPPKDFVPKDFTEMYQRYYVYVLRLLVNQGISMHEADDIAQTLFIKMDEKGLLSQFDPNHGNLGRPAVFTTQLSGFVVKYAMGFRKKQGIHRAREKHYVDQTLDDLNETPEYPLFWVDVYGPTFEEEYTDLADSEFRGAVRRHLATAHTGRKDSQLDFVALFDEIDQQVSTFGKYSVTELMEKFGVTRTTLHKWLEKLRIEISKVVADRG